MVVHILETQMVFDGRLEHIVAACQSYRKSQSEHHSTNLYFDSKLFITFVIFVILIFILELNLCTDGETAGLRSRIYIAFHLLALTGYRQELLPLTYTCKPFTQTVVSEECLVEIVGSCTRLKSMRSVEYIQ